MAFLFVQFYIYVSCFIDFFESWISFFIFRFELILFLEIFLYEDEMLTR